MNRQWKLLVIGDSPTMRGEAATTGFARVVQNLARRWAASGRFERIDFWGINYFGQPCRAAGDEVNEWLRPPFRIFPASGAEGVGALWYEPRRLQALLDHITDGDYTHIWVMQDHFLLSRDRFPQVLREAARKIGAVVFYYCPVDGRMQEPWADIVEQVDWPVAYTEFGKGEMERWVGDGYVPVEVLPHGVDARVFRPLQISDFKLQIGDRNLTTENTEDTERKGNGPRGCLSQTGTVPTIKSFLREKYFEKGLFGAEDTLLINVNMNQRRKDVVRSLEILKALREMSPGRNYKLLMHMNQRGNSTDQMDLETAALQLGLTRGVEWSHSADVFEGPFGTLTEMELNELYNACDGYLTTTLGEGWGFGMTEAMGAGLPVFAPDHTACGELSRMIDRIGQGEIVMRLPLEDGLVALPADNCVLRQRVEVAGAAQAIDLYFEWREATKDLGLGINHRDTEDTEKKRHESDCQELNESLPGVCDCSLSERTARSDVPYLGLSPKVKEWLSWDRIAGEWLRLFERPARTPHVYMEWGGGLGDVINGMAVHGSYGQLETLPEGVNATVALVCHNPNALGILREHPRVKSGQVTVKEFGYWDPNPAIDRAMRESHGMPRRGGCWRLPDLRRENHLKRCKFYLSDRDGNTLAEVAEWRRQLQISDFKFQIEGGEADRAEALAGQARSLPIVVIAAGAGLPHRNLPLVMTVGIMRQLAHAGYLLVIRGSNYARHGREEPSVYESFLNVYPEYEKRVMDLTDRLDIPGDFELLKASAGIVTAHSSLCIAGWWMERPVMTLYPEEHRLMHFKGSPNAEGIIPAGEVWKRDEWNFGCVGWTSPTVFGVFGAFRSEWVSRFVEMMEAFKKD
jgi:glycosyltransferase involved in cell wall biosynthesis